MRPGLNTWVWRHSYFGSMCGAKETRHRQSQEVLHNCFPFSVFHASYILLCHVCLDLLYLDMNWNVTSCWHLESWVFCYVLLSPCLLCYILFCLMLLGCHACSPFFGTQWLLSNFTRRCDCLMSKTVPQQNCQQSPCNAHIQLQGWIYGMIWCVFISLHNLYIYRLGSEAVVLDQLMTHI